MYYYVYDEFVQDPKCERELAKIETRLTDLGISGKIGRLALFRNAAEFIRDEVKKGVNTVVAVGNNLTLRKVIDAAADCGVAIGVIPIGGNQDNSIANLLGVPNGLAACEVISARSITELDTGVVNGRRFIHQFSATPQAGVKILCDNQYSLTPQQGTQIEVRNLALEESGIRAANPTDGKLELILQVQSRNWFGRKRNRVSIVPVKELLLTSNEEMQVVADGESFEAKELRVKVIPGELKLITSKDRKF